MIVILNCGHFIFEDVSWRLPSKTFDGNNRIIALNLHLSHVVVSGSNISPCIKINKPRVIYIFLVTLCNDFHNNVAYLKTKN